MASLKELRAADHQRQVDAQDHLGAMKMVAASKLRRAQARAEAARPYAEAMQRMLAALARSVASVATTCAAAARRHRKGPGASADRR